ncbi:MAG TPA: protease inhibitor I9 family protein, partial [Gemmatimonadales bacterium]|nr:protease inhibitor I9 family protein [Gemmatimonadales bacterium]
MRKVFLAGVLAGLTLAACRTNELAVSPSMSGPSLAVARVVIPGRYVVVYNASVSDAHAEIARNVNASEARVERVFEYALRGWSGTLSSGELARLQHDPHVAFIEPDQV